MNENGRQQYRAFNDPITVIEDGYLVGYVLLAGRWHRMEQRMLLDRKMYDAALRDQAAEVEQLREKLDRQQRKDLYDRVIEQYHRSKSHRKKTTLREICERNGVGYEALKKYRTRKRTPKTE